MESVQQLQALEHLSSAHMETLEFLELMGQLEFQVQHLMDKLESQRHPDKSPRLMELDLDIMVPDLEQDLESKDLKHPKDQDQESVDINHTSANTQKEEIDPN